jgi:hypothetical protein
MIALGVVLAIGAVASLCFGLLCILNPRWVS